MDAAPDAAMRETATRLARVAVGAPPSIPARADVVRRLDRDGCYVLVHLGEPGHPGWVAAVDVDTGDVMSWAANPSGASTLPPGAATDAAPGAATGAASAELVWRPCSATRSPLYPLARVHRGDGEHYVDLTGTVHDDLADARG